jgi:hypothetical protein
MAKTKGALNQRTNSLVRALSNADGSDIVERLASVAHDDSLPLRLQVDACKHLSGAMFGKLRLHALAKKQVLEAIA